MVPLGLATLALVVERHLDLQLGLAVLGDGEEGLAVVERLEGIEDRVLLDLAALDLPLAPARLALAED